MYKDVLRAIEGVEIFPVISFVMFGTFFIGMLFYIMKMKKERIDEMSDMPLHDEFSQDTSNTLKHEKSI